MTMLAAAGSPPELDMSKSSKSSSYLSSHDRSAEFDDISNFEEIGLDDGNPPVQRQQLGKSNTEKSDTNGKLKQNVTSGSAQQRPSATTRSVSSSLGETNRELLSIRSSSYASVRASPGMSSVASRRLGVPSNAKRGFTSPSAPSLQMTMFRKRSPSPNLKASESTLGLPSGVMDGDTPHLSLPSSPIALPKQRRESWQPNKKTVEELEKECQDSDDDIPDDTIFWNVPISPRPPMERQSSLSPSISPEHSPSRPNSALSSPSILVPSDDRANPLRSKTSPSVDRLALDRQPFGSFQRGRPGTMHKARAKSWNFALSNLSDEAKTLTEALEHHADSTGKGFENPDRPERTRPYTPEKHRSKSVVLELPLLKGNIMIDPLPISKEKEAVLTRTRPSWLPPKCQKEEKRHLKEYQKMVYLSQENERKKAVAKEQQALHLEDQMSSLAKLWEQSILPNWDRSIHEPHTRDLWWRGIAPQSRGKVWTRAIGNELSLTDASYHTALKRARKTDEAIQENKSQGVADPRSSKEGAWFAAIRRDTESAWPKTGLFGSGGAYSDSLVDVCMAYAAYRSDVGYIYGTHLIAALLLLNMEPEQAFSTLANLFNRPLPLSFLTGDPNGMARAYDLTLSTLEYKYPRLHSHLFSVLRLTAEEVFEPLFRTLFCAGTGGLVGLEEVSRLWDIMVFEGDRVAVRSAVGVLGALEQKVLGLDADDVRELLGWGWNGPDEIHDLEQVEKFIDGVREAGKEDIGRSPATPSLRR